MRNLEDEEETIADDDEPSDPNLDEDEVSPLVTEEEDDDLFNGKFEDWN